MKTLKLACRVSPLLLICVSALCSIAQTPKTAQQPDKNQEKSSDIKLGVDLVVIDALVMQQKTGRIIGDLKKTDFTLYEDGIKQQISHFSQDRLPLSVILLVDRAGCLDPFGRQVRQATVDALSKLRDEDEVAVMTFSDFTELIQPFRYDKQRAIDAIDQIPRQHDEDAGHCFNQAFYDAAQYMDKAANPAGRRVLIVITGITTDFACSGLSEEKVRNAIFESGTVVCGLIPSSPGQRAESGVIHGATGVGKVFKVHTTSLSQLAEETGGEVMSDKAENIDKTFTTLVEHLRTRYSLGFVPSNSKHDGTFRKLKLEVPQSLEPKYGKVVVKTRRGYIAGKTAASTKEK